MEGPQGPGACLPQRVVPVSTASQPGGLPWGPETSRRLGHISSSKFQNTADNQLTPDLGAGPRGTTTSGPPGPVGRQVQAVRGGSVTSRGPNTPCGRVTVAGIEPEHRCSAHGTR